MFLFLNRCFENSLNQRIIQYLLEHNFNMYLNIDMSNADKQYLIQTQYPFQFAVDTQCLC